MAKRHSHLILFMSVLLLVALLPAGLISCVRMRTPSIIPPIEDKGGSHWNVLNEGFLLVRTNDGEKQWQWQIIARFIPETSGQVLKPLDISAAVDGEQVPFTFEEDGQIFESVTSSGLTPGGHKFELVPSEKSSHPFPTLMVEFEAP